MLCQRRTPQPHLTRIVVVSQQQSLPHRTTHHTATELPPLWPASPPRPSCSQPPCWGCCCRCPSHSLSRTRLEATSVHVTSSRGGARLRSIDGPVDIDRCRTSTSLVCVGASTCWATVRSATGSPPAATSSRRLVRLLGAAAGWMAGGGGADEARGGRGRGSSSGQGAAAARCLEGGQPQATCRAVAASARSSERRLCLFQGGSVSGDIICLLWGQLSKRPRACTEWPPGMLAVTAPGLLVESGFALAAAMHGAHRVCNCWQRLKQHHKHWN